MYTRDLIDLSKGILVSFESTAPITEMKPMSDDGRTFGIPLMYFDSISRNDNLYPAYDYVRSLDESTYVQECIAAKIWYGEAEHPDTEGLTLQRLTKVDPDRIAWRIHGYTRVNDRLDGVVTWMEPKGIDYWNRWKATPGGNNIAASTRTYTPNYIKKEISGRTVLVKKYPMSPVTFDCVLMPGFKLARRQDPDTFATINNTKDLVKGGLSELNEFGYESVKQTILTPERFKSDLISCESVTMLQDLYKFDMKNAKIKSFENGRLIVDTGNGTTLNMATNNYVRNELF